MPTFFSRVIAVLFSFTLVWFVVVTALLGPYQKKNRQVHREQSVQEIMHAIKLHTFAQENYLPIEITTEWQQIGTATTGCAIENDRCQILSDACVNLHPVLGNVKELSLPAEIQGGGIARTGYAIKFEEPDIVRVVSCGSENGEVELTEQFPDVIFGEVYIPATASAKSSDVRSTP